MCVVWRRSVPLVQTPGPDPWSSGSSLQLSCARYERHQCYRQQSVDTSEFGFEGSIPSDPEYIYIYPSVRDSLEDRVADLSGVECSALGVTSWVSDNDKCRKLMPGK